MMKTMICQHDGHEWQRKSQRGRPPHFCPDHRQASPGPVTTMAAKTATIPIAPLVKATRIYISSKPCFSCGWNRHSQPQCAQCGVIL